MTTKRCTGCNIEKPISEFCLRRIARDGLQYDCKECSKRKSRAYRIANAEHCKAHDRARANLPHVIEAKRLGYKKYGPKYKSRFPERIKAMSMVNNALSSGRLQKQPCWICGATAQAHHPDYSRPMDVVWLCATHHRQAHNITRRMTANAA